MHWTANTFPTMLMTLLIGCSTPLSVDTDCAWARPIHFSAPTKAWLHTLFDEAGRPRPGTPATLKSDLGSVVRHNRKYEEFCR